MSLRRHGGDAHNVCCCGVGAAACCFALSVLRSNTQGHGLTLETMSEGYL
jgi:hypothetical protein